MNAYLKLTAAGATWPPPWRAFQKEHPDEAAALKVLWETESLVNNSVMVRDDVPAVLDGVIFDIAERKRAEEELQKTSDLLRAIIEAAPVAIIGLDLEGKVRGVWNPAAEKVLGWSATEAIGNFLPSVPVDKEEEFRRFRDWIRSGKSLDGAEVRRKKRDGTPIDYSIYASPLHDSHGGITGNTAVLVDITDRKRADEEIRTLNRELEHRVAERTAALEESNKELEAFAYTVSHDLRSPLRAIDGFVNLLRNRMGPGLDEQNQRYITTISHAARRMGMLIGDLLSFSRMGRKEMATTQVDLTSLVEEVMAEFATDTRGRLIDWPVAVLPAVTGDRSMLRIVLVNLISNALKFTQPRERAEIEIGCAPAQEAGETVIFVRDNGVGFDMQYAGKLFGVFQRLHGIDEFEGAGIGLANVRRILEPARRAGVG